MFVYVIILNLAVENTSIITQFPVREQQQQIDEYGVVYSWGHM